MVTPGYGRCAGKLALAVHRNLNISPPLLRNHVYAHSPLLNSPASFTHSFQNQNARFKSGVAGAALAEEEEDESTSNLNRPHDWVRQANLRNRNNNRSNQRGRNGNARNQNVRQRTNLNNPAEANDTSRESKIRVEQNTNNNSNNENMWENDKSSSESNVGKDFRGASTKGHERKRWKRGHTQQESNESGDYIEMKQPRNQNKSDQRKRKGRSFAKQDAFEELDFRRVREKPLKPVKIKTEKIEKEIIVEIPPSMTLRELSLRSGVGMHTLISKLIQIGGIEEEDSGVQTVQKIPSRLMMQLKIEAEGGKRRMVNHQVSAIAESLMVNSEVAELLCLELGLKTTQQQDKIIDEFRTELSADDSMLSPRAPVVTVMGHVDHGKTTLLDTLRNASVAENEDGGITQAVAAFSVDLGEDFGSGSSVVFLDTPGHEAFSSMRKCGAIVTDIVVLVIAATDGIRQQTLESIELAKAGNVPIVVALTKIDAHGINKDEAVERITNELNSHGVKTEEIGGDVQLIPVSAIQNEGLDDLVEAIKLQADMMELRANPKGRGEAVVIESTRDRSIGAIADVLVRWGTMKTGDIVVVGEQQGKVKSMIDDTGKRLKKAGPSSPIRLVGLKDPPTPGSDILVVKNTARAREVITLRERRRIEAEATQQLSEEEKAKQLEEESKLLEELEEGEETENEVEAKVNVELTEPVICPVVIKADTDGSLEALRYSVEAITMEMEHEAQEHEKLKAKMDPDDLNSLASVLPLGSGFKIIRHDVGQITQQDIDMASAFGGTIFGFNVRAPKQIVSRAAANGVDIVTQGVIYHLLDDMRSKLNSHMPARDVMKVLGSAEVLQTFKMNGKKRSDGDWVVAGCRVSDGLISSKNRVRVLRDGKIIHKSSGVDSIRHFKDTVTSIKKGSECGISLTGFQEFEAGDVIEAFEIVKE